jgi:hypothetical protein
MRDAYMWYLISVAQVTIYLPDDLERDAKQRARKAGKSLSAFFAELLTRSTRPRKWSKSFIDLYGRCDLPEIEDAPPEDVESM